MSEEIKDIEVKSEAGASKKEKQDNSFGFAFFKSCSRTLKKLSLLSFIVNIFLTIIVTVLAVVFVGVYVGTEMLSLLALPILTVVVIGIVFARLFSALIYGFAEIVEKYENK